MSSAKTPRTSSQHQEHEWMRIKEAAEYIQGTEWFVRTLTWKRAIPFVLSGKAHVFDRIDLDHYMENQKSAVA